MTKTPSTQEKTASNYKINTKEKYLSDVVLKSSTLIKRYDISCLRESKKNLELKENKPITDTLKQEEGTISINKEDFLHLPSETETLCEEKSSVKSSKRINLEEKISEQYYEQEEKPIEVTLDLSAYLMAPQATPTQTPKQNESVFQNHYIRKAYEEESKSRPLFQTQLDYNKEVEEVKTSKTINADIKEGKEDSEAQLSRYKLIIYTDQ